MKVILNNNPSDYYARISPVYSYPITIGTKVHKNMLSAIFCNVFMFLRDDILDELFTMFNEAANANLNISDIINNVIKIKDKYNLMFKTMPDINSVLTEVVCQRFRADEVTCVEQLVKRDDVYTFYDPTGLLGSNNTPFSMNLYNKILHILALVGTNEVYIIQELEK